MDFQTWISSKWGVWTSWVLASAIGWGLDAWGFTGIVGAAMLGALQWLVLRKLIVRAEWWILATAVAMPFASLSTVVLLMAAGDASQPESAFGSVATFVLVILVPGAIVGAAQCIVLVGKVPEPAWWIGASAAGTALHQAALFQGREWVSSSPDGYLIVLGLAAIASSGLTGVVLVWLLQKRGQWPRTQ